MRVAIASIFFLNGASLGYSSLNSEGRSHASTTTSASSLAPAPPSPKPLCTADSEPASAASRFTSATSSSESSGRRLIATTGSMPYSRTFSTCFARFSQPISISRNVSACVAGFSSPPPPCMQSARTVATTTTVCGRSPAERQTMSMNFSMPMSDAKPDSVIRYSPSFRPSRSATIELLPCAMLANGAPCIRHGWPSSVWIRFGLIASFSTVVIAPAQRMSSAVTGLPSYVWPIVIEPSRRRRSAQVARQRQDRRHLGGGGDVEAGLARDAARPAAEAR